MRSQARFEAPPDPDDFSRQERIDLGLVGTDRATQNHQQVGLQEIQCRQLRGTGIDALHGKLLLRQRLGQ
jgi:hypothetical protein